MIYLLQLPSWLIILSQPNGNWEDPVHYNLLLISSAKSSFRFDLCILHTPIFSAGWCYRSFNMVEIRIMNGIEVTICHVGLCIHIAASIIFMQKIIACSIMRGATRWQLRPRNDYIFIMPFLIFLESLASYAKSIILTHHRWLVYHV